MKLALALVAGAYMLGSISFSYLIVRLLRGEDVRERGSGNAGATNVYRLAGPLPALVVLALDMGKGAAVVVGARGLGAPEAVVGAAAVAVVLGHAFPIFFSLRGGKGVATSVGAFASLAPEAAMAAAVTFLLALAWRRYVSLASVTAAALFPVYVFFFGPPDRGFDGTGGGGWLLVSATALSVLVIALHAGNLRRLWQGIEPRLGDLRKVERS